MKILIVMPVAERRGGAEAALDHFLSSERCDRVDLTLVFLDDGPLAEQYRSRGLETLVVGGGRLREPHRLAGAWRALRGEIRRRRPNLALSWMPKGHFYLGPAATGTRVPVAWYQHDFPSPQRVFDRLVTLLPTSGIVATSQTVAEAQSRLRPVRRILTVHPGVDLAAFDPRKIGHQAAARQRLGLPNGRPVVGMVARLQRWKGVHLLVDAVPALADRYPGILVVVVGGDHALEPGYRQSLVARAQELGVGDRVRLAGFQSDVAPWLQAMDVVVHASRNEPFGMSVVEAMTLGKPVVAAAQGGPAEIITDGRSGLLVDPVRPDSLAEAVGKYLDDPALRERIGAAASERAADFSIDVYARRLLAALHELADPSRA